MQAGDCRASNRTTILSDIHAVLRPRVPSRPIWSESFYSTRICPQALLFGFNPIEKNRLQSRTKSRAFRVGISADDAEKMAKGDEKQPVQEAPLLKPCEFSTSVEEFLKIVEVLKRVQKYGEKSGNKLGWVCHELDRSLFWSGIDYYNGEIRASISFDYFSCKKACKEMGVDFNKAKLHLDWIGGYAQSIDHSKSLFCHGSMKEFCFEDRKKATLHVHRSELAQKQEQARLEQRFLPSLPHHSTQKSCGDL
jgi:hypothetical protein